MFGCQVIFACRSELKSEEAINRIGKEKQSAGERCSFVKVDLESLRSVEEGAKAIKNKVRHIDMLILNAGVFALPHTLTTDNLETMFQVCHLSHFYLTKLLENCLNYKSRVIVLSSESHRYEIFGFIV